MNDKNIYKGFFRKILIQKKKPLIVLISILIIAIPVVLFILPNLEKIRDRIPQKDRYALLPLGIESEELYRQFNLQEDDSAVNFKLAESAFLKGEVPESEYFINKVEDRHSGKKELISRISKYKTLRKRLETSLYGNRRFFNEPFIYTGDYKIIDEILELSDTGYLHVRHLFLKGYLLLREGRRTEARRIFDDLVKNGGILSEPSLYFYAKSFLEDEDKGEGIKILERYISQYPESRLTSLAYYHLSSLYLAAGDPEKAVETSQKGIDLKHDSEYLPELYLSKEAALRAIDESGSKPVLQDLFTLFPSDTAVLKRAEVEYNQITDKSILSDSLEMYLELCNVLIENGRQTQSQNLLKKINLPDTDKHKAYVIYLEAKRLKRAGEFDNSLAKLNKALQLSPDKDLKSRIYTLMGETYGLKKNVTSAEEYYKKSGESLGESGDYSLREIARIAYENGWREKARIYYNDIVTKYPESEYLSEALNYLVVLSFFKNEKAECEKYATMLKEKGTGFEDRLKGEYFLFRLGKGKKDFAKEYPLSYYGLITERNSSQLYLDPENSYPDVNKHKDNLGWEYFLAGCYDLAEKEYEFISDPQNPYNKMALCYFGYFHKDPPDGIRLTRDLTAGNYLAQIEQGYSLWFMEKAFPVNYYDIIQRESSKYGFQLYFILGIIRQESFFDPNAKSYVGALGLMQIMPSTGQWIAQKLGEKSQFKTSNLKDPKTNIRYGAWYLKSLRESVGNESGMILAAHNAGPGNVSKWKDMFPVWQNDKYLFYELIPSMQTRNFIRNVFVNQCIYERLLEKEGVTVYF